MSSTAIEDEMMGHNWEGREAELLDNLMSDDDDDGVATPSNVISEAINNKEVVHDVVNVTTDAAAVAAIVLGDLGSDLSDDEQPAIVHSTAGSASSIHSCASGSQSSQRLHSDAIKKSNSSHLSTDTVRNYAVEGVRIKNEMDREGKAALLDLNTLLDTQLKEFRIAAAEAEKHENKINDLSSRLTSIVDELSKARKGLKQARARMTAAVKCEYDLGKERSAALHESWKRAAGKQMDPINRSIETSSTVARNNIGNSSQLPVSSPALSSPSSRSSYRDEISTSGKFVVTAMAPAPSHTTVSQQRITEQRRSLSNSSDVEPFSKLKILWNEDFRSVERWEREARQKVFVPMSTLDRSGVVTDSRQPWYTVVVAFEKSVMQTEKGGHRYRVTDLYGHELSMVEFGKTSKFYKRVNAGTILAVFNSLYQSKSDQYPASLKILSRASVVLLGTSAEFAKCPHMTQKGEPCKNYCNLSIASACSSHMPKQLALNEKKLSGRGEKPLRPASGCKESLAKMPSVKNVTREPRSVSQTSSPSHRPPLQQDRLNDKKAALKHVSSGLLYGNRGARMAAEASTDTAMREAAKVAAARRTIDSEDLINAGVEGYSSAAIARKEEMNNRERRDLDKRLRDYHPTLSIPDSSGKIVLGKDSDALSKLRVSVPGATAMAKAAVKIGDNGNSSMISRKDPNKPLSKFREVAKRKLDIDSENDSSSQSSQEQRSKKKHRHSDPLLAAMGDVTDAELNAVTESRHADELAAKRDASLLEHMDTLCESESISIHLQNIHEEKVKVFWCPTCESPKSRKIPVCKGRQGCSVEAKESTLRHFECRECKTRVAIISSRYPPHPCTQCNSTVFSKVGKVKEKKFAGDQDNVLLPRGIEHGIGLSGMGEHSHMSHAIGSIDVPSS